jgi:hypothetical protein
VSIIELRRLSLARDRASSSRSTSVWAASVIHDGTRIDDGKRFGGPGRSDGESGAFVGLTDDTPVVCGAEGDAGGRADGEISGALASAATGERALVSTEVGEEGDPAAGGTRNAGSVGLTP